MRSVCKKQKESHRLFYFLPKNSELPKYLVNFVAYILLKSNKQCHVFCI